jgi:hypothetical protein
VEQQEQSATLSEKEQFALLEDSGPRSGRRDSCDRGNGTNYTKASIQRTEKAKKTRRLMRA